MQSYRLLFSTLVLFANLQYPEEKKFKLAYQDIHNTPPSPLHSLLALQSMVSRLTY